MSNEYTPLEMLYRWEKQKPDVVFLRQPVAGIWNEFTWSRVAHEVRSMATALQKLGVERGDRIAICSKNSAHWILADLAIMLTGGVSVPVYAHQQPESLNYILEHSSCKAIFLGKLDDGALIAKGIPQGLPRIGFPYELNIDVDYGWDDLVASHDAMVDSPVPDMQDIFTIIYTSGTTGLPKGVVHTYRAASYAASNTIAEFEITARERMVSFLPLSHVAERFMVELCSLYACGRIAFVESLDTFAQNIQDVQPTMFFAVPRLWVKFQMGILAKMPEKRLSLLLKVPVVGSLIRRKIKKGLGLSRARYIISGAAPLAEPVITWFAKLGIHIQEGYGLTENFAYGTINRKESITIGSVGVPMRGTELALSDEGEILFRSPCVMQSYFLEPEKTAEVLTAEGYLRSGDKGALLPGGQLKITGRVKEIFKTSKGKYVAPATIEGLLSENTHFEQICVMGSGMNAPVGLVVLSDLARGFDRLSLSRQFEGTLQKVNSKLEAHEKMSRLIVVKDPWTVEGGLMTPTMKIKRHLIEERYLEVISKSSSETEAVYWEN